MERIVVIMGVAGSGKSVVGELLARRLRVPFCEGDDLHAAANVAKIRGGRPLDDADRRPWLAAIAAWIADHRAGGVVSCSALKRAYRDRLRQGQAIEPRFVLLDPPRRVLDRRLAERTGHFMPPALLDSQLAILERPGGDERALIIGDDDDPETIADLVVSALAARPDGRGSLADAR